jgi:hypothetical protein
MPLSDTLLSTLHRMLSAVLVLVMHTLVAPVHTLDRSNNTSVQATDTHSIQTVVTTALLT